MYYRNSTRSLFKGAANTTLILPSPQDAVVDTEHSGFVCEGERIGSGGSFRRPWIVLKANRSDTFNVSFDISQRVFSLDMESGILREGYKVGQRAVKRDLGRLMPGGQVTNSSLPIVSPDNAFYCSFKDIESTHF